MDYGIVLQLLQSGIIVEVIKSIDAGSLGNGQTETIQEIKTQTKFVKKKKTI